jgi:ABC-type multidrug transport system fused ATPase/permease subunit
MSLYLDLFKRAQRLFKLFPFLVIALVVSGVLVSVLEGLTMTLIVPLLQGVSGSKTSALPEIVNVFAGWFDGVMPVERVRRVAWLLLGLTAVKGIVYYFNAKVTARLVANTISRFRRFCFTQLLQLSTGYLEKQKSSDLFTIASHYTSWMGTLVNVVGPMIPKLLTVLVLLVMLFMISWQLTLVSLVLLILSSVALRGAMRRAEEANRMGNEAMKKLNGLILSAIGGMRVIKAFNRESLVRKEVYGAIDKNAEATYMGAKANASVLPMFEMTSVTSLALILVVASFILNSGMERWVEVLLTFVVILFRLIVPVAMINQGRASIAGVLPAMRGLDDFLSRSNKTYLKDGSKKSWGLKDEIRFEGVSFKYEEGERYALEDISFGIKKGEKVAIVGPSGGGKSTLTGLLLRFYDPDQGQVTVDGVDLKDLNVQSWRDYVGVVTQDTFMFNDTICANIGFADPGASFEDIKRAAELANAHEFIEGFVDGYDTLLGDRGVRLSGGQKQRIAIARAILRNPQMLVLDEATSALDSEAENLVQDALDKVGEGRTSVVIAHRL